LAGMERFTQRARRVLSLAHQEAERTRQNEIRTEHLLLGLIQEEGGVAGRVLRDLGLEIERVREITERLGESGEHQGIRIDLSQGVQQVLEYAIEEARRMGHHYIGTEHLLLGLLRSKEGLAMNVLRKMGVTSEQVRRQTRRVLQEGSTPPATPAGKASGKQAQQKDKGGKSPLVDQLAVDLTAMAESKKLDPVIGRQMEIERVIQILARRTKNNPALIGEPGVGKTAIVEGLAQRIIEGDVPAPLLDKQLLQLDVGSLVAGTMYRGQFEERLKRVIDELKAAGAILFIDEVHMLVGAGSAGSSVDAANILKPALSRGELQVIGATTLEEYRKHIESDAALERRFQPITVEEPSIEETIQILHGINSAYEEHHRLSISEEAMDAAARLSARYISGRFLPDKAIDLIDESASRVRMYKSPTAVETKEITKELRSIRQKFSLAMEEGEQSEVEELTKRENELTEKLDDLRNKWDRDNSPIVTAEDIAEVISMLTGVPLMQLEQEESRRLLDMEDELSKSIIGQTEAIETISKAVRRARSGLKDPSRPIGSFIFLGPTGVGKTELTKALGRFMFGSEDTLIQLDMSEFMERHSVSRLVGAPPGYVGYEEAGQLTETIRRKPYSIVVFDEIEKAHPEAHNMLLQIMEEGQLSDARGQKVDFRNAIIVMTSNIGADVIKRQTSLGFQLARDDDIEEQQAYDEMRKKLLESLKRVFRPEFINRVDGIIVFRALSKPNIREIVVLELDKLAERLKENGLTLEATDAALDQLVEDGYDADMGARPLRRVIQNTIEDKLSDALLGGDYKAGDVILVDIEETEDGPSIFLCKKEDCEDPSDETEEVVSAEV
jgi:ATP-dependent Clp protease ATP-binding subunit ClpC